MENQASETVQDEATPSSVVLPQALSAVLWQYLAGAGQAFLPSGQSDLTYLLHIHANKFGNVAHVDVRLTPPRGQHEPKTDLL